MGSICLLLICSWWSLIVNIVSLMINLCFKYRFVVGESLIVVRVQCCSCIAYSVNHCTKSRQSKWWENLFHLKKKIYLFNRISSPLQPEAQIPYSGAERQKQKRSDRSLPWTTLGLNCLGLHSDFPKDPTFQKIQKTKHKPLGQVASPPRCCSSSFPGFYQPASSNPSWTVVQTPDDWLTTTPPPLPVVEQKMSP